MPKSITINNFFGDSKDSEQPNSELCMFQIGAINTMIHILLHTSVQKIENASARSCTKPSSAVFTTLKRGAKRIPNAPFCT